MNKQFIFFKVAFTEFISGRAPENRGNGLKFVRKAIAENPSVKMTLSILKEAKEQLT